ncbi:MAG: MFS transporter [Leptolyngbya sp. PLA3]|nr:MAG: MFS transporter [Cyanobacteria bacterium CYA]MCE7968397.1 MFS transporter [Leptolyngbya sp. PL-A3]
MPFPLNPFRGLPNGREVWAWGMYDLANQSFQLLINTLLFSLFVANVIAPSRQAGLAMWSRMGALAMILVVLLSPIAGALADQRAWKRKMLLTTGVISSALIATLALLQPGQIGLTWALYLTAAVACGLGENFLGSFLPEISTVKNIGRVSAIGWTMSYVGAVLLLGITAIYAFVLERPDIAQARPMFVFSGLWFAAGILPAFFLLREKTRPQPGRAGTAIAAAFVRLAESARQSARYRQLVRFFLAFFVYSMGVMTMVYFLGLIGDRLGFQLPRLIVLALIIAVTAGAAAAIVARVQDRVGHKRTIAAFLLAWIVATLAMAGAELLAVPAAAYWVVAALIGVALGGVGTASRAMVGAFTPPQRAGEFFGLWGMVYKLGGIAGVLAFGFLAAKLGQPIALLIVAAWFVAGLLLLLRVDEREGVTAAESALDAR